VVGYLKYLPTQRFLLIGYRKVQQISVSLLMKKFGFQIGSKRLVFCGRLLYMPLFIAKRLVSGSCTIIHIFLLL
ncbi:hypothetical protein, partial [Pseudoalteromonas citrea]|uniref:hypothetical protein n=1 Tax=Pseudoalteromonas citrea TaxID=43655 RepID=UPI001BB20D4D